MGARITLNLKYPSLLLSKKARFTLGVKANKNLGPTLSILGLQIGPKGCTSASQKFDGILFFSLGANTSKALKVSAFINTWGRLKSFFFFFLFQP